MKYNPPFGSADANASYVDRNTPGAVSGSRVPAAALEQPQREIVSVITGSGLEASANDMRQLAAAIRSQRLNYAEAAGTVNALTCALSPALTSHIVGMPLRVKVKTTNTGAATLNAGAGVLPIRTAAGEPVKAGELQAGAIVSLLCTGAAWVLTSGAGQNTERLEEIESDLEEVTDKVTDLDNALKGYVQQVRLGAEITAGVAADTPGYFMKRWYATGGVAGYDARFRPVQHLRNGVWVTVDEVV